jgi:hypothetical protein
VTSLNDLTDVTLTAPLTLGSALVWNGTQWVNRRLIMDDLGDADTTTTVPTDGQVLTWDSGTSQWRPETASAGGCQLFEMGGASAVGGLAIGDGTGTPGPVATGWILQADSLHATATTPPTGSALTFDVRLFPANSLIASGTVAAGATQATFTTFANVTFADGQWVEVRVTGVGSTTAGNDLTVTGELCGPGVSSATPTIVTEVGEGSVLPANDASGELFRLMGHAVLSDGLYRWNNPTNSWIQV